MCHIPGTRSIDQTERFRMERAEQSRVRGLVDPHPSIAVSDLDIRRDVYSCDDHDDNAGMQNQSPMPATTSVIGLVGQSLGDAEPESYRSMDLGKTKGLLRRPLVGARVP